MFTTSKISKSIKLALSVSVAAASLSASNIALAQDASSAENSIEKISVTGSRIKRTDLESASPVTVIDRSQIELTGISDVGDFIQSLPSMSGSPIGTTTNNGGNGSVQINLRGLGATRTLTLVNGKRTVDGGDYQAIPAAMIERVEILKDGASAIYGADAVAGVVNIITRKDFDGVSVSAQTAEFFDTDGSGQTTFSVIAGREYDRGNFVFGVERVSQDEAFQRDVPWDFMQNSYYIYPAAAGGCENDPTTCYPIGSSRIPESRLPFYSQGTFLIGTPASADNQAGLMVPHDGRTYNYAPVNYLQTPYERTNVFAEGTFEISDSILFSTEFRLNKRTSAQQLAPLPFTGGDPMYNGFYDDPASGETVAFTGISQDNYYLRQAVDLYNTANGTSLVYEPVVNPRRRMIETNRRFEQDITQYQWNATLNGELDNDMSWEAYVSEGSRSNSSTDFGQFAGSRLSNALGPSADLDGDGSPECYTDIANSGTLIQGCVPLNLFGGGTVDAGGNPTATTLTQEMLDYVSLDTIDSITQTQRLAGLNLAGYGLELPGGELGWSVGWSYWKQTLDIVLDSAKTIGAVTGNVGASTNGVTTNNAVSGEIYAPLFDNGEQSIALKAGIRYDDWDVIGSDVTYQLGFEATVIPTVKLRSTYGTVFRAPTISNLFGGVIDGFPTYSDPCIPEGSDPLPPGCAQVGVQLDTQTNAKQGGNPNLDPEEGQTLTVGVVWSPDIGDDNFSITADYWDVELEKGISSLGVTAILNDCYLNETAAACALITRDASYAVTQVLDQPLNLNEFTAKGVDLEFRYSTSRDFGNLSSTLIWTHLLERGTRQFAGGPLTDFKGTYSNGSFATNKANLSLTYQKDDFSVSYLGEYISSLDVEANYSSYDYEVEAQYYSDLAFGYTYDKFKVAAGITNITDEAPPYIDPGFNASTDPSTYRMFGRGYYLRLTYTLD